MAIVTSYPQRGEKIVDNNGVATERLSRFFSDITESNNNDAPLNNFRASTPPAVTDNRQKGYSIGSEWIDAPTVYRLVSFVSNAPDSDATWVALN